MLAKYLKDKFDQNDMHPALVARKLDVGRSVVHNWINGDTIPSFENCCKISELIGEKEKRSPETVLAEMKEQMNLGGE
jgi:transcriptional regulator with XRE-family HTH domain